MLQSLFQEQQHCWCAEAYSVVWNAANNTERPAWVGVLLDYLTLKLQCASDNLAL